MTEPFIAYVSKGTVTLPSGGALLTPEGAQHFEGMQERLAKAEDAYAAQVDRNEGLEDALRLMLDCLDRHDGWCGHNADAPGDGIINDARDAALAALSPTETSEP